MPKVGKVKLKYDGAFAKVHDIWYTSKDGFHVKDVPSAVLSIGGANMHFYNTEAELVSALEKACFEYREFNTSKKKVILYKVVASSHLRMNFAGQPGHYVGQAPGVSNKIISTDFGSCVSTFGFEYKVKLLQTDGVVNKYYDVLPDGSPSPHATQNTYGYQIMDWSQEREDFFEGIYESMKKMVVRFSAFVDMEPEVAAQLIESKQPLLGL